MLNLLTTASWVSIRCSPTIKDLNDFLNGELYCVSRVSHIVDDHIQKYLVVFQLLLKLADLSCVLVNGLLLQLDFNLFLSQ